MLYRRHPTGPRRYVHAGGDMNSSNPDINTDQEIQEEIRQIPLPNEVESTPPPPRRELERRRPSFLDAFKNRIQLDEIILLGLILLLMDENMEDDLLLIILIYLLLAGKE